MAAITEQVCNLVFYLTSHLVEENAYEAFYVSRCR
jgi:hypothetical protein